MNKQEIKKLLLQLIDDRLLRFGIETGEVKQDFDLVRSGLLDSMTFVDLIGAMEEMLKVEIDFEKIMEEEGLTTVSGIIDLFMQASNE